MAYYLFGAYGGHYRLDDDWYTHIQFGKYGLLSYNQDYGQNYQPYYQRYGYPPGRSLDYYYEQNYDYWPAEQSYDKSGQYQSVSDEAMLIVHHLLQHNEIVLFTLTNCSSCGKAITRLDGKQVPYLEYNIDSDPYIEDSYYLDALEQMSGIRNVPQLFIYGEYYGDGGRIKTGLERGEIQRLCHCGQYSRPLVDKHRHSRHWGNFYKSTALSAANNNQVLAVNNSSIVVQKHLQNNAVVLFALTNCDSCSKTESLLFQKHVPFKVYYVDADPKARMIQYLDTLEALSNSRNLPQLYIRGNYYGDSQKTREGLESGEIQRLCNCGNGEATTIQQRQGGLSVGYTAQTIVQQLLKNNKVMLFVFTNCAPCEQTKVLLEKHHIPYGEHYIDQDPKSSQNQYFDALESLSGIRTVPQLFIHGRFYGDSEKAQVGIDRGEVQRSSR